MIDTRWSWPDLAPEPEIEIEISGKAPGSNQFKISPYQARQLRNRLNAILSQIQKEEARRGVPDSTYF